MVERGGKKGKGKRERAGRERGSVEKLECVREAARPRLAREPPAQLLGLGARVTALTSPLAGTSSPRRSVQRGRAVEPQAVWPCCPGPLQSPRPDVPGE